MARRLSTTGALLGVLLAITVAALPAEANHRRLALLSDRAQPGPDAASDAFLSGTDVYVTRVE